LTVAYPVATFPHYPWNQQKTTKRTGDVSLSDRNSEQTTDDAVETSATNSSRGVRLNAHIAHCSAISRRGADRLIRTGRVEVNGRLAVLGERIDPERDTVTVYKQNITLPNEHTTILLYKPAGYLVSRRDPHHNRTVYDLIPPDMINLVPVGRLDLNTEGLLLLTDDGDLVERLTHPRHDVPKVYHATVRNTPDEHALEQLRTGIDIDGQMTRPAKARLVSSNDYTSELEIILREGRKRQVRLMCRAIGHSVTYLIRTQFAGLTLDGVELGSWRALDGNELNSLREATVHEDAPREDVPQQGAPRNDTPHEDMTREDTTQEACGAVG
jgi:23S rRNA pseudouridine2605 synthase